MGAIPIGPPLEPPLACLETERVLRQIEDNLERLERTPEPPELPPYTTTNWL